MKTTATYLLYNLLSVSVELFYLFARYRPDLLNWDTLEPDDIVQNNQLAFDILESELGLQPVTTGQEVSATRVVPYLSYLCTL